MKKIRKLVITIILILIFIATKDVYAASGSLSVSSSSVYAGDSFTATVNVSGAASWNVHVSASGPVSGCSINEAGDTGDESNQNKTFEANCTATGEGTITISLSGDVSEALPNHDIINSSISGTKTVTVTKKQGPLPSQVVKPNQSQNQTQNQTQTNTKDDKKEEEVKKSNNNKIKELAVVGYDLIKTDDNNYRLSVGYDVDVIVVKAVAEDKKAAITGNGEHTLHVGKNDIELVVTAEDGTQNKVNIVVNRKEEVIEEPTEPVKTIGDDNESKEKPLNIIAIAMIGLNVILAISVVALLIKNNKLKKMNN